MLFLEIKIESFSTLQALWNVVVRFIDSHVIISMGYGKEVIYLVLCV